MNGISVLIRVKTPCFSLCSLPCKDTTRSCTLPNPEEGPPQGSVVLALSFGLLNSSTVRNKFLLFKPPSLRYADITAWPKTDGKME